LASLERAIEEVNKLFGYARPWWRGHGKQSYQLVARVFRAEAGANKNEHYNERELLALFRSRAETRRANCPVPTDHIGWMFLAQHYGLPTRLLDWSESPLAGLYFAVSNKDDDKEPGHLHALSPGRLNWRTARQNSERFSTFEPFVQQYALDAIGDTVKVYTEALPKAVAISTREIDVRMLVQQAAFTLHEDGTQLPEIGPDRADQPFLATYVIPAAAKSELRSRLAWLGFRPATVYPDLEHLAAELRQLEFHRRPV
jgi:hypothetical protein